MTHSSTVAPASGSTSGTSNHPNGSMDLLTVDEAATRIHKSVRPSTIRAAIKRNELTAIKIGRRLYVKEVELERFLECQENVNLQGCTNAKTMARGSSSTTESKSGLAMVTDFVTKQKRP